MLKNIKSKFAIQLLPINIILLGVISIVISINPAYSVDYYAQESSPVVLPKQDTIPSYWETELPIGIESSFSPAQDSTFKRAMEYRIPPGTRIKADVLYSTQRWRMEEEIIREMPIDMAMRRIEQLNPDIYMPNPVDVVHQYTAIRNALYVPFAPNYKQGGLQVPFQTIGKLLGLVEDVSPVIGYRIDFATEVEVVVYSMQASVIAILFRGEQAPGYYTFTWNLRNENGKLMPAGDYIAEVRIGNTRLIRKRIVIPK
jgi:hypothetical protein